MGSGSSLRCRASWTPVQMRIAPKMTKVKANAEIAAAPTAMKTARKMRASTTPKRSTRWCRPGGTANWARMMMNTKRLSTLRDFSTR
ncbi:unannotated protein [freshwater metagenome]|uniref:Unannotated protein n=1 Tax=freshwater metagenome TaxID=449393 RepID=A0A6J7ICS7_9ZZZZ